MIRPAYALSRLVEQDGPRQLHRHPVAGYIASCHDCRWAMIHQHRIDAEDALDAHDCSTPKEGS